jgi:hypothetical protein
MAEDIKKWDEYKWETIFREEDECINAYMRELPRYIDLPDEEEILFSRIKKMQKALPEANELYDMLFECNCEDCEDCDGDFLLPEDWRDLKGADIYRKVLELSLIWTRLYSASFKAEVMNCGLKGICLYGGLLSRLVAVMEIPAEMPSLVIANCKRLNSTINEIVGLTNKVASAQPELHARMDDQASKLLIVREKILNLMFENKMKT